MEGPRRSGWELTLATKLIAFLLAADALASWIIHTFPALPWSALWRHAAVGTLAQSLGIMVLSLLMALAAGVRSGSHRLIAATGRIGLGAAAALLALLAPFVLDSHTLSATLPEPQRPRFAWLVAKGIAQCLLGALCFVATAMAARRFRVSVEPARKTAPPQ